MNFAFFVSNRAGRLTKFLRFISADKTFRNLLGEISFVYRDNELDDEISEICRMEKINYYRPDLSKSLKHERELTLSEDILNKMKIHHIDYLFVFGVRILRGEILNIYQNRIINFHPSLLPAFPGLNAIDKANEYGSILCGNTAHFINSGIDTGEIIMQNISVMEEKIDYDIILDKQIPMLLQILLWLKQGRISVNGRRVKIKEACYCAGEFVPNLEINLSMDKA